MLLRFMRIARLIIFIALVVPAAFAAAADEGKTGSYHTTFTDRSPLSAIEAQAKRFGWQMAALNASQFEKNYDLANESFEVNVPENYKAGDGWGLLVWVSAGGGGNVHEAWRDVLEKQ